MLRYPYCNRRRCQKMQQETNTSIEILVELAIADAVFETGGDKHTSYRFRPPAVENLLVTMSQAVNKNYGCCFLSTQCSLSHTHTPVAVVILWPFSMTETCQAWLPVSLRSQFGVIYRTF